MIKLRPEVELRVPRIIRVGGPLLVEVLIKAEREVNVKAMTARLRGVDQVRWGNSMRTEVILNQVAQLSLKRTLHRGEQRFRARFRIPKTAAPSYSGKYAHTWYEAQVHVSIPWWLDRKRTFALQVQLPTATRSAAPRSFTSGPDKPYVEWSVDDTRLRPGATLRGAIAFTTGEGRAIHGVEVCLIGMQPTSRVGRVEAFRYVLSIPVDSVRDGEEIPFRMRIPDLQPTVRSKLWSLEWELEVRGKRRFAPDVRARCDVTVLPAGSQLRGRAKKAPSVGTKRLNRVWAHVARATGFELDGDVLTKASDDGRIEIRRERRERGTDRLVAEISYRSLHLGLDGGPLSGFHRFFDKADRIVLGHSRYVTGRELRQVRAFTTPLRGRGLARHLADIHDEGARLERAGGGQTTERLRTFVDHSVALANAVKRGRGLIPAPRAMEKHARAWRATARRLEGTLEVARMAISAESDGYATEIATEWWDADAEPVATWVIVHLARPLPEKRWFEWARGDDEDSTAVLKSLRGTARQLVGDLMSDCEAIRVDATSLRAGLPAPLPDPRVAVPQLDRLLELAYAFRRRGGAYR